MLFLFCGGLLSVHLCEQRGSPQISHVNFRSSRVQPGGNMEGREVRFGITSSTLTAVLTSNIATGSYNSIHDSFSSRGGMILLTSMLLGELVSSGLGSGLYSMVMAAAIAVFLGGHMVGRAPEYLGKKIGPAENKMIMLYALAGPLAVLPLTAIAVSSSAGLAGLTTNSGPHGFTEILFGYTSCFANNGRTFSGLSTNTPFYNLTTVLAMMVGRFGFAIPALALAALFGHQRKHSCVNGNTPHSLLHLRTAAHCLLIMVALSYLPSLALGPVLVHLQFGG